MVIQRWQSVILLLACAMMACFSFCSLGEITTSSNVYTLTALGFTNNAQQEPTIQTWYLFALSIMSAIIPLIAIFCYHNLKLQRCLCVLTTLFSISTAIVVGLLAYNTISDSQVMWQFPIACPLITIVAAIWARKLIISDAKKLAAAERFYD